MKIGIVGAGKVGTGLGTRLAAAGHDIAVSFARTPDQVTLAAQAMGQAVRAETPETAVRDADVVILATPWGGDARHRQEALAIAYR